MKRWKACATLRGTAAAFLAIATTSCGNLTAGGIGQATVAMSGDAPDPAAAPPMAILSDPQRTDHDNDYDDSPEGEVEAELSVFLVAADGGLVALTDGDVEVQMDLEGTEEPEIGSRNVSATTYTALRMIFTSIEVEVDPGLVVNGDTITGEVDVEIDDVDLPVDRTLDLQIGDGERVEILIDLNSERWLQAVDPRTQTVDAQVFAELVSVRVR
ncbi:MAG: hypothetical protein U5R14_09920 [Gemmatimonadota bacterium]|nr:hypothetical protein [Gemmatimonadota bacterium]